MYRPVLITLLALGLSAHSTSIKDGHHIEYFKKNVITEGKYENGTRIGQWSFYFPNKKLNISGEFDHDLKVGVWQYYDDRGRLISRAHYSHNELNGPVELYNSKEDLIAKEYFENGKKTGLSEWYTHGWMHHKITPILGGRRVESFYRDGTMKSLCNEWDGKQNDTASVYYPNGELKEVLIFYRNLLLNVTACNNDEGEPLHKGNLVDGDGLLIRYYNDGAVKSRVFYSGGLKNGIAQFYHSNGELKEAGMYHTGKRSGIWKYFDENGTLLDEREFRHKTSDAEFENEFSFKAASLPIEDTEATFPGGNRSIAQLIKEQTDSLEFEKGGELWLSVKVDELGFPVSGSLHEKKSDGELVELPFDLDMLPRCVPAFKDGLPIAAEILHVAKI